MLPLPLLPVPPLNWWKPIIIGVLVLAFTGGMVFLGYKWGVRVEHDRGEKSLAAQIAEDKKQCDNAQKITEEASRVYQGQLLNLRSDYDALMRVRPKACVPVHPSNPASGHNGATDNPKLPYADGLSTDQLYQFGNDCEQVGRQLDSCQSFIRSERAPAE